MAQWQVGAKFGWLHDKPKVNTQYAYNKSYEAGNGCLIGLPAQYNFNKYLGVIVEPELQYRTSKYSLSDWHHETKKDINIDIPIMGEFSFGSDAFRGFVRFGGYIGGWLAEWQEKEDNIGKIYKGNSTDRLEFTDEYNRFDAGITGGIGCRLFNDKKINITLEYRLYFSQNSKLNSYIDGSDFNYYDNLQSITVGVNFNLDKSKNTETK